MYTSPSSNSMRRPVPSGSVSSGCLPVTVPVTRVIGLPYFDSFIYGVTSTEITFPMSAVVTL